MADRQYVTQQGRPAVDKAFNGLRTVTRISSVSATGTVAASIEAQVFLAYGTADTEFTLALLVKRGMSQVSVKDNAYVSQLTEVYQEFTAGQKVSVGEDQHFKLEDGRYGFVRRYVALASEAEGLAAAIGDVVSLQACQEVKINKQGVGAEIVETYISAGILAEVTEYSNNGALETRSITYYNGTPSTPAGFTLTGISEQNPDGLPGRTYRFAKGDGQISYDPSSENNGKLLKIRIRHLTAPAASNPISTPFGYAITEGPSYQEADGHRIWSAGYAKGDGETSRTTDRSKNGTTEDGSVGVSRLDIDYLTAPAASEPTWASVSGFVKITVKKVERDGHLLWSAVYAKGAGTVNAGVSTRSMGKLIIYRLVGLGTAPTAPTATIGGTVTLFDTDVTQAEGHVVYDYRWCEAMPDGRVGISTSARTDGSLVYTVREVGVAIDTPAYPGSGSGYLVDLDNNANEGHYLNVATYIKPPPDVTLKVPKTFNMPGTAVFSSGVSGHDLLLSPSKIRPILADEETSYSTSQLTTAHWQLLYGCYLNVAYTREGATQAESQQQPFSNYVSAGGTASGSAGDTYNGVAMDEYAANLEASSPTSRPSGSTVIEPVRNELYLTAIDGTQVFRRTLYRYTF
jgi:hypothetical protein